MEQLKFPPVQLAIYLTLLVFTLVFSRLNSATVIQTGVNLLLGWTLLAVFAGIPGSYAWSWYGWLAGSLITAWLVLWACMALSNRFGEAYHGEGVMFLLAPLSVAAVLFPLAMIIKFLWQTFHN
ncbi:MAG: hypothetical protein OEZ39_00320 [Gammaproteobacteria bacterium]|nr:hypothetical protein [Gammaproteobacteria bacterium]MDH5650292.1 hypothetical protein [Gammaproteobacteria bacterium]